VQGGRVEVTPLRSFECFRAGGQGPGVSSGCRGLGGRGMASRGTGVQRGRRIHRSLRHSAFGYPWVIRIPHLPCATPLRRGTALGRGTHQDAFK
jgi:hypothetical protein